MYILFSCIVLNIIVANLSNLVPHHTQDEHFNTGEPLSSADRSLVTSQLSAVITSLFS